MNFDSVVRRALSGSGASAPHSGSLSNGFVRVSPLFLLLAATSVHAAPPEIDPIVNQFTRELPVTPLQIDLGARDLIDGDGIAEFSFTLNPVPTVNFCSIDHVAPAGTGTLSCDPQLNDGGNYTVTVTATDDSLEQESASTQFVLDVNTTPSINGILTQSVVEAGSIDISCRYDSSLITASSSRARQASNSPAACLTIAE